MSRNKLILLILTILILNVVSLVSPFKAQANNPKTFFVLPFRIIGPKEYQYLAQGTQTMLTTRLTWPDHLEPREKDLTAFPKSPKQAGQIAKQNNLDYLIYGSLTLIGSKCNLETKVVGSNQQTFSFTQQTELNNLIPTLDKLSEQIKQKIFPYSKPKQIQKQSSDNPNFIYTQPTNNELNPYITYVAKTNTPGRWRSQTLNFPSRGLTIGDVNKDGKAEIFILGENKIYVYQKKDSLLKQLAIYSAPTNFECLNINLMDLDRDGFQEIIVSAIQGHTIRSFILRLQNNKLSLVQKDIPFLMNVVRVPPDYRKTLIGQKFGHARIFDPYSVYELIKIKGKYQKERRLSLPKYANVFNFTYLPEANSYKIIVNHNDHLYVYSDHNSLLAKTEELYAATGIGIEYYETVPGLAPSKNSDPQEYYISARLIPINLDKDNKFELLVSRPISLSVQMFYRYRDFSQGEIHCLYWDGIGLNLRWKTKRIKGTITDYGLYDIDGDGRKELVVCINTFPGVTGFKHKKTIVLSYKLGKIKSSSKPK